MWVQFQFVFVFHSSLCKKIYTAAKAQSFAVTALLPICIGNTTLFAFEKVTVTLLSALWPSSIKPYKRLRRVDMQHTKAPQFFYFDATAPQWAMASLFTRFLDHTRRRPTFGRTPLDDWSARRKDFYLTTHNTYNRQTSIPSVGFQPANSAG
jgi:hypothetical protein